MGTKGFNHNRDCQRIVLLLYSKIQYGLRIEIVESPWLQSQSNPCPPWMNRSRTLIIGKGLHQLLQLFFGSLFSATPLHNANKRLPWTVHIWEPSVPVIRYNWSKYGVLLLYIYYYFTFFGRTISINSWLTLNPTHDIPFQIANRLID